MELIVISSPDVVADESIIINDLFQSGLNCFHIRKPNDSEGQIRKLIDGIYPMYYSRLALHQHHQIADGYGIKRLHYTESARKRSNVEDWQMQTDQGYTLSTSVHDIASLSSLISFDYVFYGPVFNSISKPGYHSGIAAGFKLNKEAVKTKVIALGGVEASNFPKIKTMNFDGAAVLGTIWNEPEKAVANFRRLKGKYVY